MITQRTFAVVLASALVAPAVLTGGAGCLLTSDFDGVAGTAPADGGPGSPSEGGGEASPGDGGTSPCTSGSHVFCSDFDDIDALPVPGWTSKAMLGSLTFDTASPRSRPHALVAKVKGSAFVTAYLLREGFLGATFTQAILDFDFRLTDCPAQGKNALTFVFMQTGLSAAYGFVILSNGELAIGAQVSGMDNFFPLEKPVKAGVWTHISIRLAPTSPSVMHVSATVDGAKGVDTDAPSAAMKSTVTFNLGVQGATAALGCEVAYDNVVLDKQ